jgi:uncharacterized metal-binding protein YceD (DUF177 family)
MPLPINLRHLEEHPIKLQGELSVAELDLGLRDDIIGVEAPLEYDLEVQKLDDALLVQGRLGLMLQCKCVRCLKPFQRHLELKQWTCHVPLQGEEKTVVINDCVDLTPQVREDILLEFPQHPLCEAGCRGLPETGGQAAKTSESGESKQDLSAWAELDKLKL